MSGFDTLASSIYGPFHLDLNFRHKPFEIFNSLSHTLSPKVFSAAKFFRSLYSLSHSSVLRLTQKKAVRKHLFICPTCSMGFGSGFIFGFFVNNSAGSIGCRPHIKKNGVYLLFRCSSQSVRLSLMYHMINFLTLRFNRSDMPSHSGW